MKKFWFYYVVIAASAMLLWLLSQTANAGVIPGTLNKGTYTSSTTCGTSTNSYDPSGGYCSNTYCRTYAVGSSSACWACTSYQQLPNTCSVTNSSVCGSYCTAYAAATPNYTSYACTVCTAYNAFGQCTSYGPGTCSYVSSWTPGACIATAASTCTTTSASLCGTSNGACLSYPSCRDASFGCADYYHYPIPSGTLTFTNYLYANTNPNYWLSGDNRKLGNDTPQTCNKWANGTNHTAPWMWGTNSCQDGSSNYYIGGANGVCDKFWSTDNLITSFNQVGAVTRSAPVDTDATCTVQGRYASADDSGPSVSLNGVSNVFDGDQNSWCNYTKYRAANYGTTANPELPGCKYYKDKISHGTSGINPDLLEGLTITVDDPSGISQVTIEIGNCTAVYDYASDVSSILVSTTAPSGVKSAFKGITYNYNIASTSSDSSIFAPSLLQKFGVTRLDACLTEGKNYLKVLAKDQARSDADGVSYAPNFTTKDLSATTQFIKIDNAGPAIGLTGNAAKIAESNATADMFVGWATIDSAWKNYTITGGLKSTDPFGAGAGIQPPSCASYTGATYTCTTSASKGPKPSSAGVVWSAPVGVNGTTGVFTGYMCDSLGPIPSTASCDWSCATGYTFDTTSNSCVASSNLFILFAAGTPNATGNVAAKLTSDSSNSRGLLKTKNAGACAAPFDTTVPRTYSFKYQPLATYNFSTVPTGPFQIVENGISACSMPPPPPPTYTYSWYYGDWKACQGQCGTNGTRSRTVVCKRSDGSSAAESRCTTAKPPTSEPCAMAVCPTIADNCPAGDFSGNTFDGVCTAVCTAGGNVPCIVGSGSVTKYRNRWCQVTNISGTNTIGYGDPGSADTASSCWDSATWITHNAGTVIQQGANFYRCDSKPDTEVDVNVPLPDKYCPVGTAAPICNNTNLDPEPGKKVSYAGYPFKWNGSTWEMDCSVVACTPYSFDFDGTPVSSISYSYAGNESWNNVFWSYPNSYHVNWNTYQWEYPPVITCSTEASPPACTNGTVEISPTPSLNCADTSTASSWYKSAGTGRCGEQEGIDYWNNIIAAVGVTAAKSSFDNNIVNDCVHLSGTSDLTACFSKILCGYGDYVSNTNQCVRNDCGLWKIDGMCGSANGGTFSRDNLPPDTQQCSSGIAIHSQVANGKFDWKCDGRDGGTRVSCSANVVAPTWLTWMKSTPSGCIPNTTAFVGNAFTGYEDYIGLSCSTLWDRVSAWAQDYYGNCPVWKKWIMTLECGTSTPPTYWWITWTYGTCSATCGGGTQIRTVVCQDNSGNVVSDSLCAGAKPAESTDCNTSACPIIPDNICPEEAGVTFTDPQGNICIGTSPQTVAPGQSAEFCDTRDGRTGCATRTCQTDGSPAVWGGNSYTRGSCAPTSAPPKIDAICGPAFTCTQGTLDPNSKNADPKETYPRGCTYDWYCNGINWGTWLACTLATWCFAWEELVTTPTGVAPISSLKVGDKVMSYNESTKQFVENTIDKVIVHDGKQNPMHDFAKNPLLRLTTQVIGIQKQTQVTANHLYYSPDEGIYKEIKDFRYGERIQSIDGIGYVVSILQLSDTPVVYNLHMANMPNNYLVNGVVVHNEKATACTGCTGSTCDTTTAW